ncbi:TnpV protein [Hespellia stercorisuis]|nr:TnpV protein [Hespellia stercorisuis]
MKTSQQLIWVQRMNSIRNQVGEIFLVEIIYS